MAHELAAIRLQAELNRVSDRNRIIESLALAALKGLTIVNGGAVVAVFTLLAQGADSPFVRNVNPTLIFGAVAAFASGVGLSLVATLFGFFSQQCLIVFEQGQADAIYASFSGSEVHRPDDRVRKWGNRLIVIAALVALLSLGAFARGSFLAVSAALDVVR